VAYHLAQVFDSLVVALGVQIVVGIGVVPVFHGAEVHRVTLLFDDHILGIVYPVELSVALGQPGTRDTQNGRLRLVEARHIGKSGCRFLKLALLKLRLTHEQPGPPEEGVVFAAPQPLQVLGCLSSALIPFRASLDAVLLDGFLRFLYGAVEVAFA